MPTEARAVTLIFIELNASTSWVQCFYEPENNQQCILIDIHSYTAFLKVLCASGGASTDKPNEEH